MWNILEKLFTTVVPEPTPRVLKKCMEIYRYLKSKPAKGRLCYEMFYTIIFSGWTCKLYSIIILRFKG